MKKILYM